MNKFIKIIPAMILALAADIIFEVNFPVVREININTEKMEKGQKITFLQVSDFHGSTSKSIKKKLIKEAHEKNPDAVLITGDLVDRETASFDNIYSLIKELRSACPNIFFVSGNHEWGNDNRKELIKQLKDMEVVMLNNKNTVFTAGGTSINICGVDDPYIGRDNVGEAMKDIGNKKFTVLLAHSPGIRYKLENYAPDLILCGHTHGGQIRLPFVGAVVAPGEDFLPKFDKGMFRLEKGSLLYIDSGVGTSTLPLRFMNRSQISVIRIRG